MRGTGQQPYTDIDRQTDGHIGRQTDRQTRGKSRQRGRGAGRQKLDLKSNSTSSHEVSCVWLLCCPDARGQQGKLQGQGLNILGALVSVKPPIIMALSLARLAPSLSLISSPSIFNIKSTHLYYQVHPNPTEFNVSNHHSVWATGVPHMLPRPSPKAC